MVGLVSFLLSAAAAAVAAAAALEKEYRITKWETDDGLPENSATAMAQTPDGYVWFGTFNGLVRFDGVRFTVFDPTTTPEMPSPAVVNVHLHRSGRLWVSTYNGFVQLKDGRWRRAGLNTSWTNRYVRSFAENASGVLCATSFDGAICRIEGDEIIELPAPPGVTVGFIGYVAPDGRVFAVGREFFGYWDGTGWISSPLAAAVTNTFNACVTARDGALWITSGARLMKIEDGKMVRSIALSTPLLSVWSLFEDDDGSFWVPSYQRGLYRVSAQGNVELFGSGDGLSYDSIRFVYKDRERNLWVGTSGGGLMRFRRPAFTAFGTESSPLGQPVRVVKSVCEESPGTMLLGTYGGGVARLEDGETTKLPWVTNRPIHYVQCVLVDRRKRAWIGSWGIPVLVVRDAQGERRVDSEARPGGSVNALFEDSSGRIWIGGSDAVVVYEEGKFQQVATSGGNTLSRTTCFAEHPTDRSIWMGNHAGIHRFENGRIRSVDGPIEPPITEVQCLHWEADGSLWVGTASAGLYVRRGETWAAIMRSHGLPSDSISSVLNDGLGNLWLGSNRGILRAPRAAFDAVADGRQPVLNGQTFTVNDGLASVECASGYQPCATRDSQGRLWFATVKGLAMTDPKQFQPDTNPPPVLIESASYINRDGQQESLDLAAIGPSRVPAGSSQFRIRYTSPSFADPTQVRFRHMLVQEGKTVDRTETANRSTLSVLLPPGDYRFHVEAVNHHGYWNTNGATLEFTVQPFYWQTLWFRVLIVSLALAGGAAVVWSLQQGKLRRQREQLAHERALSQERERFGSAVEKSERALRAFMDALPAPAMLIDRTGAFAAVNRPLANKLGRRPDELLGKNAYELFPPSLAVARRAAADSVFATGQGLSFEEISDGRHYDTHLSPVTDASGAVTGVAAFALDVTRHRQLEEQVRQAQKMEAIGQLAGGIAHDFNNILGAILLSAELAAQDAGPNHPATESLDEIVKAGRRAKSLVQQILSFSRRQPPDRRVVALGPIVEESVKFLRATIPAGVELVTSLQPDAPRVIADPTQLHQVLVNLGANAWHALENHGNRIEIKLDAVTVRDADAARMEGLRPGQFARLTVSDNGVGMDESTLRRIFEPFFTTKELGKGTGLGLSVVHGIVRNHDGGVKVTSQPGQGATFEVFLPAVEAPETTLSPPNTRSPLGQGQRILYLDDEAALVAISSRMLERLGYSVNGFTRVGDALAAFRANPDLFDLVVTDQNMPDISGLQFAAEILKLRPAMPVVLNSGHVTEELKHQARSAGIRDIFYKPNTVSEFGEGIHRLVTRRLQP